MTHHPPHITRLETEVAEAPTADLVVEPRSVGDVASVLRHASQHDLVVQVWGGGTHSGFGSPPPPDIVMSMAGLSGVETWEPDDLTIVLGAGASVAATEGMLAERNQSLVMPERPGAATIGGVIASGASCLRRGRLFAVRERVLEVTSVTGDGRVFRSGGRVVKNVTGYDLHRLAVGAFGAFGVIVSVCLKLWPTPPAAATVRVPDAATAQSVTRPLAVVETNESTLVFLWGTDAEVAAQTAHLGGEPVDGLHWPEDPDGPWGWSLRVPPALLGEAIGRLPENWRYLALHGVGELRAASDESQGASELRSWAEAIGGNLVVTRGRPDVIDPWGAPPPALELQRRLVAEFDPKRIINPGRLPGGI